MKWTDAQQAAFCNKGENLIVSASAGSGKTAVLVERIINFITGGGDIRRLVVLTFTKDAAAEMKERVLQALLSRIRTNPEDAHLALQAECLPFANVMTIDGYCLQLVKRYFNELEEEASADVLSDDEEKVLLSDAADDAIDSFFETGDEVFFELLDRFVEKRSVGVLKETIFSLHRFLAVQTEREAYAAAAKRALSAPFDERESTLYLLSVLKTRAAKFSAALRAESAELEGIDPAFTEFMSVLLSELEGLATAPDFQKFSQCARHIESTAITFSFAKARRAFPDIYEAVKNLRDDAKKFLVEAKTDFYDMDRLIANENAVAQFSVVLLELAAETDKRYRAAKRERGKLDFADVERLAYRVLSDNGRRKEIAGEIDAIYLDEYQDTNYLQESILMRLSRGGNVFMVGDPKQAIYRFRLAEPKIFVKKYRRYSAHDGGGAVDLNENFRSDPRILSFVNLIFDDLMTDAFGGVDYRAGSRLKSGREDTAEKYRENTLKPVEICLFDNERRISPCLPQANAYSVAADKSETAERTDTEGLRIARKIKEILGETYYDAKADAVRAICCSDIAVLVPKNANARQVRATLVAAGIPAAVGGNGKDGDNPDVVLLRAFLSAADNRKNDVPLILCAASPLGGFSADELAEIRESYAPVTTAEAMRNQERTASAPTAEAVRNQEHTASAPTAEAMQDPGGIAPVTTAEAVRNQEQTASAPTAEAMQDQEHTASAPTAKAMQDPGGIAPATNANATAMWAEALLSQCGAERNGESSPLVSASLSSIKSESANTEKWKKVYFWEAISAYNGNITIKNKINKLFRRLDLIKTKSGFLTVKELFYEALRLTEYDAYLMGKPDGAERLQKLNLYCNGLSNKEYAFCLKDYLRDAAALPSEVVLPATDGDAVKVMTYHACKGLEFPVVFVARAGDFGTGKGKRKGGGASMGEPRTFFDREFGVAVKFFEEKTSALTDTVFTLALKEKEKSERREESLRLVYVALTRAKNRLYVVGKRGKNPGLFPENGKNFADWFEYAAEKNPMLLPYCADFAEDKDAVVDGHTEAVASQFPIPDFADGYPYLAATRLGVKYTVSEINDSADEDFIPSYTVSDSGGKEEGILYHKVLQYIDLSATTTGDVETELARMASEGVLGEDEAKEVSAERISAALRSEVFCAARKGRAYREQPFMLYLPANEVGEGGTDDKILIQGIIDLLIVGDEVILVDYKDTALTDASALQKYKKQIDLYALAASRILGRNVDKKLLYLINRNAFIEVP